MRFPWFAQNFLLIYLSVLFCISWLDLFHHENCMVQQFSSECLSTLAPGVRVYFLLGAVIGSIFLGSLCLIALCFLLCLVCLNCCSIALGFKDVCLPAPSAGYFLLPISIGVWLTSILVGGGVMCFLFVLVLFRLLSSLHSLADFIFIVERFGPCSIEMNLDVSSSGFIFIRFFPGQLVWSFFCLSCWLADSLLITFIFATLAAFILCGPSLVAS